MIIEQNYAVIDASGTSTGGGKIDFVALSEDNQLKFSYKDSTNPIGSVYTVKTWKQGSVVDAMTRSFPLAVSYIGDGGYEHIRCLDPGWLTSGGVVFGSSYWAETIDTGGPLFSSAGTQPNDPDLGNLHPEDIDFGHGLQPTLDTFGDTEHFDVGPYFLYVANSGTYCVGSSYESVNEEGLNDSLTPSVMGDESRVAGASDGSYEHLLYFTPNSTFDPHTYTLGDTGTPHDVSFTRIHYPFKPTVINEQGWCAGFRRPGGDTSTVLLWNAQTPQEDPKDCGVGLPVAMSDANDLLIDGGASGDSFLIEQGDITRTRYFKSGDDNQRLIPEKLQTKIRNIHPFAMSDRPTSNSTAVHPVLHILFRAEVCVNVKDNQWAYETLLLRLFSDESTDLHQIGSEDQTSQALSLNDGTVTISKITSINSSGVIAAIGNAGTGDDHALLLVPVDLSVDANRDGSVVMSSGLPQYDANGNSLPTDRTSQSTPYRFWLNGNDDRPSSSILFGTRPDTVPPGRPDYTADTLISTRDLEDWTRLWLNFKPLLALVQAGQIKVGLKWRSTTGQPGIKLVTAAPDGGLDYLTDPTGTAATTQLQPDQGAPTVPTPPSLRFILSDANDYHTAIAPGGGAAADFVFPASFWSKLSDANPVAHFLFEGSSRGQGELEIVFLSADGQKKLGMGGSLWLDLRDVREMYQRMIATGAGPTPSPPQEPYGTGGKFPDDKIGCSEDKVMPFVVPYDETRQGVVFVHGYWTDYEGFRDYAETFYKRLWWQGYKGRFIGYTWPALSGASVYNSSEWVAWLHGRALMKYIQSVQDNYDTFTVAAHSQGNVVVGSAIQEGLHLQNYIMLQAALPLGCYTADNAYNQYPKFLAAEQGKPTPDYAKDLGYRGFITGASGNVQNYRCYYNPSDYALVTASMLGIGTNWEADQIGYKPDRSPQGVTARPYGIQNTNGSLIPYNGFYDTHNNFVPRRRLTDVHESMSFVTRPRSQAVGADKNSAKVFLGAVDLSSSLYRFDGRSTDHSGQFLRDYHQVYLLYKDFKGFIAPPNQ